MSAASAALLKVCAPIYIDDTALISQRRTMESADEAYMVLARVCGIVMSEKKEANQKSTETNKVRLLGLDYTWKRPLALRNASDARTAQDFLDAGAQLVQLYTGFIYGGPRTVRRVCAGLRQPDA